MINREEITIVLRKIWPSIYQGINVAVYYLLRGIKSFVGMVLRQIEGK